MSVSDEILQTFAALATPTIANALDDVGFEGVMQGLAQVVPGTRCVGRAVTIREITGRRGDFTSEDFKVGDMIDAAGPGDILVIDNGGRCVSTFGGLATLAAKVKGVGGLVADGGVRDQEEMIEHRFPVFARHMTPLDGPHPARDHRHQRADRLRRRARARRAMSSSRTAPAWCASPPSMPGKWPSWRRATPRTTNRRPPSCPRACRFARPWPSSGGFDSEAASGARA